MTTWAGERKHQRISQIAVLVRNKRVGDKELLRQLRLPGVLFWIPGEKEIVAIAAMIRQLAKEPGRRAKGEDDG